MYVKNCSALQKLVVADFNPSITSLDLTKIGAISIATIKNDHDILRRIIHGIFENKKDTENGHRSNLKRYIQLFVGYKNSLRNYKIVDVTSAIIEDSDRDFISVTGINSDVQISVSGCGCQEHVLQFTDLLDTISIQPDAESVTSIYPMDSYILIAVHNNNMVNDLTPITSLTTLFKILKSVGRKVRLEKIASSYKLIDRTADKDYYFNDLPEVVNYLSEEYQLTKVGMEQLIEGDRHGYKNKMFYVFNMGNIDNMVKHADAVGTKNKVNTIIDNEDSVEKLVEINKDIIKKAVDIGDKNLLDLSFLASIANNRDIIKVLVDSTHLFEDTVSELGRTLLLLQIKKKEFIKTYTEEEYTKFINDIKTLFEDMGSIVSKLHDYIDQQSQSSDK
jgi:hypothetical protein